MAKVVISDYNEEVIFITANQLKYWDLKRQEKKDAADIALANAKRNTEISVQKKNLSEEQLTNLRSKAQELDNIIKKYEALEKQIYAGDYELGPKDTMKIDLKGRQELKDIGKVLKNIKDFIGDVTKIATIGG